MSLVGTIAVNGPHIHISLSNGADGTTIGGHLPSLEERMQINVTSTDTSNKKSEQNDVPYGSQIYTTAEIVISEQNDLIFLRCN